MSTEASAMAMKLLMNGDMQGAIAEWKKVVQSFEESGASPTVEMAKVYYYLGKTQLDERLLDEAIQNLTEAERLFGVTSPEDPDLRAAGLALYNALRLAGRLPEPVPYVSFKKGLKALQKTGRLSELKLKEVKSIFKESGWDYQSECDDDGPETLVNFMHRYYLEHEDLAVKDGFITHDWRYGQETDDAPAEFAALLGDANPLFKQLSIDEDGCASMLCDTGEEFTITFEGLHDIADLFNAELKARGDERRFVPLDTGSDFYIYLLLKQKEFKALCQGKELVLPVDTTSGFEEFAWS